jgi:hypothetical protein
MVAELNTEIEYESNGIDPLYWDPLHCFADMFFDRKKLKFDWFLLG